MEARRTGKRSRVWTSIAGDASPVSPEYSWKAFVESGIPHSVAVNVEEPVTGKE